MSSTEPLKTPPRVAAILVVCNGAEWLPDVLNTLERLRYPELTLVAVDAASSDGSDAILAKRLSPERVLRLDHNPGFGRAVAAAVGHFDEVSDADLILLVHDDLLLAPGALVRMVHAIHTDPSLGIVGPKLREWGKERVLQEVGLTIDRLGRTESGLDPGELDQGQHDTRADVLYVSTAGMLLRREVIAAVGGFDARYPAFRDDLDLCWRAWLAGYRVEVVSRAVGYHRAVASKLARPVGSGRGSDARYLAERHALATLLKNYGLLRLLLVLPVVLLVGLVKVMGFTVTRRFGDAFATVRAWVWNVMQLPRTVRRRRRIQAHRTISDREIARLFARGLPRLRTYGEALGEWVAGGSTRALLDDETRLDRLGRDEESPSLLVRAVRDHPAALTGVLLAVAYAIGVASLLGPGPLVGGEVMPWPESARDFLGAYAGPWRGEPLATGALGSPALMVLGAASALGAGSMWLAQRIVVLGLVPLAWLMAVRAGRLITPRPGPRALGATLYVLSPIVLGALGEGRLGVLVVAALLPGLVLLSVQAATGGAGPVGWRATGLLLLGLVVAVAFAPELLPVIGGLWLAALVGAVVRGGEGRWGALLRVLVAGGGAAVVLAPWLVEMLRTGWPAGAELAATEALALWRALALAPDAAGFTGADAIVVITGVAVALTALLLGLRVRPGVVAGLVLLWILSGVAAWGATLVALPGLWAPGLLLPAVLAQGGLGVLVVRWLADSLRTYAFGLRQVTTVAAMMIIALGLVAGAARMAGGPWTALERDPQLVPAFVAADTPRVGPYRVLVLDDDQGAAVRWEVRDGAGPRMDSFGTVADWRLARRLDEAVSLTMAGQSPAAASALGRLNVRYVVAPAGLDSSLVDALNRQPALDPLPAGEVHVWRVQTWLPRAVVLPADRAAQLASTGDPGRARGFEGDGLDAIRPGRFAGANPRPDGGVLVLSEGETAASWRGVGDVRHPLEPVALAGFQSFEVPPGIGRIAVQVSAAPYVLPVLLLQALVALAALSITLRPFGAAARRDSADEPALPADLQAEDVGEDGAGEGEKLDAAPEGVGEAPGGSPPPEAPAPVTADRRHRESGSDGGEVGPDESASEGDEVGPGPEQSGPDGDEVGPGPEESGPEGDEVGPGPEESGPAQRPPTEHPVDVGADHTPTEEGRS